MICPIKTDPNWIALEKAQPDLAYYLWNEYEGEVPAEFYTPSSQVKEGVPELFESNPELANAVYEALGFNPNEFSLVLKKEEENPEGIILGEYDIINKGNIIGNVFLPLGFKNYTIKGIGFKEKFLNKGLGKAFYKWLGNKADIENATLNSDFDNTSESAKRVWESLKKENFAVDTQMGYKFSPKNLKQQAEQLYSQYLDSIFPDSEVKDIVYHGSLDEINKFNENQHFGTFDQANLRILSKADNEDRYDDIRVYPVLININNSKKVDDAGFDWSKEIQKAKKEGFDSLTYFNEGENYVGSKGNYLYSDSSYLVFNPENSYILGNQQDIEGFKKFVQSEESSLDIDIENCNLPS